MKGQTQSLFSSRTTWSNLGWLFDLLQFFFIVVVVRNRDIWGNSTRLCQKLLSFTTRYMFILKRSLKITVNPHTAFFMRLLGTMLNIRGYSSSSRVFIPKGVVKRISSVPSFGERKKDPFSAVFFTAIMHPKSITWKLPSGSQPGQSPAIPGCRPHMRPCDPEGH